MIAAERNDRRIFKNIGNVTTVKEKLSEILKECKEINFLFASPPCNKLSKLNGTDKETFSGKF